MWLYRYETKGIQSWILDSNLLRDLAGGSALVENLTRIAEKKARKAGAADILQSTSGSMTARFPNQATLQAFASEWPMEVALKAPGLHLVHAWSPEDQGLKGLFKRLAQRRNRVHATGTEAGPWVMRAGRSGLPALNRRLQSAARQTAVDSAAVAKEAALGLFRTDKGSIVTGGRSWDEFEECLDLWPEGPVAVIHADGSGVGKRLVQLGDDHAALARFSENLKQATAAAIREAVDTLESGERIYARPIVSAGDDLTYILPSAQARVFATTWLQAFENETKARSDALKGKMSGGAGIAIVHRQFPFGQAYEMAEHICSAAKKAAKEKAPDTSVLAFRRITTSLVDDVSQDTVAWFVDAEQGTQPLATLVDTVRDLPRGTLRNWLTAFERGDRSRAASLWARAREVADKVNWDLFARALEDVGGDPESGGFREPGKVALPLEGNSPTPVRDALTLRFIERAH